MSSSGNMGYSSLAPQDQQQQQQPALQQQAPAAPQQQQMPQQAPQQQAPQPPSVQDQINNKIDTATNALNAFRTSSMAEAGSLGAGVIANVGKIVGSDYLKSFDVDRGSLDNTVEAVRAENPIAGSIGKYAADTVGALAATPSAGIGGLAVGGALGALATTNSDNPALQTALGAAGGAVGGTVLKGIGQGLKAGYNALQGARLASAVSTSDQFANKVISSAIDAAGGKNVNLADTIAGIKNEFDNQMTPMKDALYQARDDAASQANGGQGITVDRSGFASALSKIQDAATQTTSPQINSAIKTGMDVLGDGNKVPFSVAQNGINNLRSEAYSAASQNNNAQSTVLMGLANVAENDLTKSIPEGSNVAQLHDAATDYARNVYYPIKNSNIDDVVAGRATETKYLASMLQGNLNPGTPSVSSAMSAADPEFQAKLIGSHINAIKDATTPAGDSLDLSKFSNSLSKSINTFSSTNGTSAFKDSVQPMVTLANVMKAASVAGKGGNFGLTQLASAGASAGAGAAMGGPVGAIAGGLAGAVVPKLPFMYAAGKMINNPAAMSLLHDAGQLSRYPNADMTKVVGDKLVELYHNQLNDIPTRLLSSFGLSDVTK